jgi:LysM repeat protein
MEEAGSTLKSVGESALSVGKDVLYGGQRIGESWGVTGMDRAAEIGAENERAWNMLVNLVKFGADVDGPLYELVRFVIEHEVHQTVKNQLTPKQREKVKALAGKTSRKASEYVAGRVIGSAAIKIIVKTIAKRAATTALYKRIATQIGVSAGASSTGIGIPVGGTIAMGIMQRASNASRRLRKESPLLYHTLRKHNLDMGYFLVEPVLEQLRSKVQKEVLEWVKSQTKTTEVSTTEKDEKPKDKKPPVPESVTTGGTKEDRPTPTSGRHMIELEDTVISGNVYTVQRSDTLWDIARRFGVPGGWKAIWQANRETVGPDPDLIYPGQRLIIPR